MIRIASPPFLRAVHDVVSAEPWQAASAGSPGPLLALLPHWDSNSGLSLLRHISIDVSALADQCGFDASDKLRACVVWRSSGTALRGRGSAIDLLHSERRQEVILKAEIPGTSLAEEVQIQTVIILAEPGPKKRLLSARRPGSIVWEDRFSVALEGEVSRFPMEVIDFSTVHWTPYQAGWYLSWRRDELHIPFLRSVCLYLNSSHPAVIGAIQAAQPTAEQQAVRSAIYYDVGRQLIRGALQNDDFVEHPSEFVDGTTGHALLRMIRTFFSADTPKGLRSTMLERPEYFDSLLQGSLKLFAP